MGLHSYSWSSSEAESWGCVERRLEVERKEKCDFPRKCYWGANPVLVTCTAKDNLRANVENVGRKYYTCKGGGCSMLKWWDDVVMEELQEMKMEKENSEDRLRYINKDCEGAEVDPQMMWTNVRYTHDDVNRLHLLIVAGEEKYEELKSRVDELARLHLSIEVKKSCMAVKEMKILTAIAISVALVGLVIFLFK